MRSALWSALLCGVGMSAAAQQRTVTFEEPSPVAITGFAVGRADYDRVSRSNTFTAGKIGVSLFKPVGDAYLFAQLTTALEDGASSTEIDNLLVSWTPHTANKWSLAFGRFDAPIGFERDDEPLNLIPTNSFSFTYARPGKLTGVQVHYTASPRVDVWGVVANGWDVTVDNNRGKTGLARIQVIPIPWVTLGFTGAYGPERDSSDANQRSLFSSDLTIDRGRLIVGAEANFGRDQQSGGNPSWRAAAVTAFLKMSRQVGLTARYDQMEDTDGLLTGTPQILRSVTLGPMWYFSPPSVAATYAGAELSMLMPPETTMVVQRPMSMADFAGPEVHTVDTKLLIQDTHVHVPMYGLIAAALGVVVVGLSLPRRRALGLIALLFAAPWLDFAGMWLTKLVSPRFAIVTIAAGWAMGVAYLIVAALAIHQMWLSRERG